MRLSIELEIKIKRFDNLPLWMNNVKVAYNFSVYIDDFGHVIIHSFK